LQYKEFPMRLIASLLFALALLGLPAAPARATAPARPFVQRDSPLAVSLQITDPGSSPSVVFSLVYTATVMWPETALVTVTTTLPPWMIVASTPGCTRVADGDGQHIGCAVDAQASQPADIVLRFAVPWDIRGKVAIQSRASDGTPGSVTARTSFVVPPQSRLSLVLR
jgi:hypothetical protein